MTVQQVQALRMIGKAILESVCAAGSFGAPGGIIYAGMMTQGCTLDQYEQIMSGMVGAGVLTKDGDCYHVGPKAALLA